MFSVLIPVGPDAVELERLADTLDSLRAHESPSEIRLILVDDAPRPRPVLAQVDWPDRPTVIRTPVWGRWREPYFKTALIAGAMEGLREAARADTDFCVKIDTDALVIAPFSNKIRAAFDADPRLGMVGSYDKKCTGEDRDFSHKARVIASTARRVHVLTRTSGRQLPKRVSYKTGARRRRARQLIDQATANGYQMGAHCLGGAYAISPAMLARGALLDYEPWADTWDCGEDVTVSLTVFAAGLRIRGMVERNQPFGLAWKGLPASPEWLVEHGSSLIHSTKDFNGSDEQAMRTWFREHTRPPRKQ